MHPSRSLLNTLFSALDGHDHEAMAGCYADTAEFTDIAFTLRGKRQIHAMWHMIAETDLRASFEVLHADDGRAEARVIDDYTFRDTGRRVHNVIHSRFRLQDGLIVAQHDSCDALRWGVQALGPVKGVLSWLFPAARRSAAMDKLARFIAHHPEYQ
jgi:hypothetical protein